MDQWVIDRLKEFREIYLQYNQYEPALSSCALTMLKIINGLSEMSHTQFHRYEKKMLWEAMELFSKQCIQQIYAALECQGVEKKKEYIVDIESSISEMADVYKNIMGGVSSAERQVFQSLSVDIRIHDLSPKLCAFYSSILKKVVEMFRENGIEYAFVLHPVLRSTIEAKVLLEKREQSGKVVIIYVSENVIEEFDLVSICLLHEAFHVLTKTERMRDQRAIYFMLQMIEQMRRLIFRDVSFEMTEYEIKDNLMAHWFRGVGEQIQEFILRDREDKSFYGEHIKADIIDKMKEYLGNINAGVENEVMDIVCKNKEFRGYSEYQQQAQEIEKNVGKIKRNIFYIVSENLIEEIADQIMFIYRETYADISCILLLEIEPQLYQRAFSRSIQFRYNTSYVDDAKNLRESLVAKIISEKISPEFQESWRHYADVLSKKGIQREVAENGESGVQSTEGNRLSTGEFCDKIEITNTFRKNYENYLMKCADAFSIRLRKIEKYEEFRTYMKEVITGSPQQLLKSILSSDFKLVPVTDKPYSGKEIGISD